jgi:hypothetical protein
MEEMDECNSFLGLQEENAKREAELDMLTRQRSNSFVPVQADKQEVTVVKKTHQELTDLYLQQELRSHTGAVWCMKFSRDGTAPFFSHFENLEAHSKFPVFLALFGSSYLDLHMLRCGNARNWQLYYVN